MYIDYFGFREKPFSITPDPRFFYTNPRYQKAYASLLYGVYERRGLMVMTGEIGTGKTTLLRRLMEHMQEHTRCVFFDNTTLPFDPILDFFCQELGLPIEAAGRLQKTQVLRQFLLDRSAKSETIVLMIDEAQNLREEVLENLRLLSNLETSTEKLLQIVLVGQPELESQLDRHELRPLKQRVAIQCRLECLNATEVGPFIHYRLAAVGYKRQQLFTPAAIQEIAFYSNGFPRLINILCDNALLVAYGTSQQQITPEIVREAAEDLRLGDHRDHPAVADETAQPPEALERRQSSGRPRSALIRSHGTLAAPGKRRWRVVVAVLLLGVGGLGACLWWFNGSLRREVRNELRASPAALAGKLSGSVDNPGAQLSRHVGPPLVSGPAQPPRVIRAADPTSPPDLPIVELPIPNPGTHVPSERRQEAGDSASSSTGDADGGEVVAVTTTSDTTGWREKPITVQSGSTVVEIAANVYGVQRNLGLDLIKEYNTHIENLNRVIAGQRLWLPPISRETMVRQQPDGSYRLILTSLRNPQQSAQLAQTARLKGYEVAVSPRRLSDDLILYRVEIDGLENLAAVNQAWEVAAANRWLALVESSSGRRF